MNEGEERLSFPCHSSYSSAPVSSSRSAGSTCEYFWFHHGQGML